MVVEESCSTVKVKAPQSKPTRTRSTLIRLCLGIKGRESCHRLAVFRVTVISPGVSTIIAALKRFVWRKKDS